jgi:hypothetical protein
MEIMFARARENERVATELTLQYRREWYEFRKVEKLERALRVARTRLHLATPATQAR